MKQVTTLCVLQQLMLNQVHNARYPYLIWMATVLIVSWSVQYASALAKAVQEGFYNVVAALLCHYKQKPVAADALVSLPLSV